jgi:hypothetical protein
VSSFVQTFQLDSISRLNLMEWLVEKYAIQWDLYIYTQHKDTILRYWINTNRITLGMMTKNLELKVMNDSLITINITYCDTIHRASQNFELAWAFKYE